MTAPDAVERFIARWQGQEGGQEHANYGMFLSELCGILGVPVPDPAGANTESNDYVFERAVKRPDSDGRHRPEAVLSHRQTGSGRRRHEGSWRRDRAADAGSARRAVPPRAPHHGRRSCAKSIARVSIFDA